jgi:hypothetical protein
VNQQWPIYYKMGITREELVQEVVGSHARHDLFDPERGLRFVTTLFGQGVALQLTAELGASAWKKRPSGTRLIRHWDLEENSRKRQ